MPPKRLPKNDNTGAKKSRKVSAKVSAASPKSLVARKNGKTTSPKVAAKVTPVRLIDRSALRSQILLLRVERW